ncbi:S49 family peptidase [Microbulbifer sp. PSTR4-B]|uniref:S49 family peptidase n=1 Tax=unclassified Microbulbifer TaxID=2619833 RepID=UPI00403AEE30
MTIHSQQLPHSVANLPLMISEAGWPQMAAALEQPPPQAMSAEDLAPNDAELASGWAWVDSAGGYYRLSDEGVAIISVIGPSFHRGYPYYKYIGIPTYLDLRAQLIHALDSPRVSRIVLEIDSPGGMAAGLFDLARFMLQQRGEKPITAFVNENACSAAYGFACAADHIVATESATVGSIGVIAKHLDRTKALEGAGFLISTLKAGEYKDDGSPDKSLDDETRGRLMAHINELYSDFCQLVADARGLDVEAVRNTEAGVFSARQALEIGLIDEITTYNDFYNAMAGQAANNEENGMFGRKKAETTTPDTAAAGEAQPITMTAEELEAHKSQAISEHMQAHQSHMQDILQMAEEAGCPELAAKVMAEGSTSLEDARAKLFAQQSEEEEELDSSLASENSENPLLASAKARAAS